MNNRIRFEGGGMDGKRAFDAHVPETIRYTTPGGPQELYVHSSTDDDGTLVFRKK